MGFHGSSSGSLVTNVSAPGEGAGMDLITAVSFSAVSTLSVDRCFSATYDNYQMVCYYTASGSGEYTNIRMRAASSDNTAASYDRQQLKAANNTLSGTQTLGATSSYIGLADSGGRCSFVVDILRPYLAAPTLWTSVSNNAGGAAIELWAGSHNVSTAFDGLTIYPNAGTFSGTIRIYGRQNS